VSPADSIEAAVRRAASEGEPALVAFLTAGYPSRERFREHLLAVAAGADVVEIGVPFTDPMADGVTIQRSSQGALAQGVSLRWILAELESLRGGATASAATGSAATGAGAVSGAAATRIATPLLLMSYLNPLLAFGFERLAESAAHAGVAGFIVPDLPFDESAELRAPLGARNIALVQMVTPVTPLDRLKMLCAHAQGFVYAVTMTGTTGKNVSVPAEVASYLDTVRALSPVPVCAGFGIRSREQVARLKGHVDGVVIGSALVEVLERGEDPTKWLQTLRG
jgi:tryptophan synthase alpha chain